LNIIRRLKDKSGNIYYNEEIPYTTDEKKVGTWYDGKPIYRIVAIGTIPSENPGNLIKIPNIDTLIKAQGSFKYSNTRRITLPYNEANYNMSLDYLNNYIRIVQQSSTFYGKEYILVIEYTKTTD
jgi:hypothetical protein